MLFIRRLHGAFMVAAWIGAASCGILLARYFKKTWVGSQCCGKDLWFVFHRFFMVLTWVLTVAGVVLMLVELKGLSAIPIDKNPHALLGGISTILCFLNPFMALCRPAPDAKSRPIFNWSHWFVGNAAQILGIVAIFYAIELPKASLPTWMNWVVVAFVAFHVLAHLALSLHEKYVSRPTVGPLEGLAGAGLGMFSSSREQRQHEMYAMREIGMSNSPMYMEGKLEPKGGSFRRTMLGLYLVINWLFTAVLVVIVVLAPIEDYLKNWSLK
ncbi:unnamed protein product [Cyprideis torosa]|uniref:ascorbate ferrireductase (transmembrane) n=1 Tax=Cyprideis torosa TaxID=163714 RepID=A0A7R8ZN52_9CRUS|nr:unnamed protein product [Cyprideis torosa]CAG0895399.1 unnamed protein product [Cyprideis torosa]